MMHHPNMHHQAMSGHPPQHMPGHQGMPAHHQMPPHQMHRDNRHVTLTRVGLGGVSAAGGLGAHGQALGMHHQRPPHPIRPMPHHQQSQHHAVPPQPMKQMRRPYVGGMFAPSGGMPPQYVQPPPHHMQQHPPAVQQQHSVMQNTNAPAMSAPASVACSAMPSEETASGSQGAAMGPDEESGASVDGEAGRPAPTQANSKEKTPMCLVNELARYNKIKHQYRLTSETGPAHKKVFTVTLRLGDTEEYTAEGSSIKRAQHAAAARALSGTRYPPPPPRAAPLHPHHHHHPRHAVMPTVELNALAMKLCQPAIYTTVGEPAAARPRAPRAPLSPFRLPPPPRPPHAVYRVRVMVGGRSWTGEGGTPQAARHDAAARALGELRPAPDPAPPLPSPLAEAPPSTAQPSVETTNGDDILLGESGADLLSEVKSPVSLVHELALKRNLSVQFTVKSERGPPHMRVFVTACTVGDMETEGEGNGKKVSKRRAAEKMLEEMKRRWPPALLKARPQHDKRRQQPAKKKPRNLIKEGGETESSSNGGGGADNPISRLAMARHAMRARSPQYCVVEERGAARRREFVVQCVAPPYRATGQGLNKKQAKRRAATNVLLEMEASSNGTTTPTTNNNVDSAANNNKLPLESNKTSPIADKRKENDSPPSGSNGEARQPVPGVLMMDYHQRPPQPPSISGTSETSPSSVGSGGGGSSPGAKDQLMYLSQLLGFSVQFSDFPKRNHGEYLSLVSLSTEPPVMCHGGGASTALSHEQCSRAALRALALMGLDPPPSQVQNIPAATNQKSPNIISNGISE